MKRIEFIPRHQGDEVIESWLSSWLPQVRMFALDVHRATAALQLL
ncbi:hypothetical protein [Bradyrhizobium japonicum]|nr:hypothetical protein [Bradyrhizobium japonicum]